MNRIAPRIACLQGIAFASLALLVSTATAQATQRSPVDQVVAAGCDKNLVLLGELPSHGEAKAFEAKAQVVTRLVEECGFDALLFEAPMYEFEALRQPAPDQTAPVVGLENAIGRFWTTAELAGWRTWLLAQTAGGRLRVGGIDDQPGATSARTRRLLPGLIAAAMPASDGLQCREVVARHLTWGYTEQTPFDGDEKARLLGCANAAQATLSEQAPAAGTTALASAFRRYVRRQAGDERAPTRDDSMLSALEWHLAALPRGSRVVIWTSTVHAAREPGGRSYVPLGHWLAQSHGKQFLAVGFTAAAGTSSMAGAGPRTLEVAPPESLEARALGESLDSAYVGGALLRSMDGRPSRLYGTFSAHPWSRHFDAVVVYRNESAPTFPAIP